MGSSFITSTNTSNPPVIRGETKQRQDGRRAGSARTCAPRERLGFHHMLGRQPLEPPSSSLRSRRPENRTVQAMATRADCPPVNQPLIGTGPRVVLDECADAVRRPLPPTVITPMARDGCRGMRSRPRRGAVRRFSGDAAFVVGDKAHETPPTRWTKNATAPARAMELRDAVTTPLSNSSECP